MTIKLSSSALSSISGAAKVASSDDSQTKGIKITGTIGQTYDLDSLLAAKRRDNSDASLMAQIDLTDLNNEQLMYQVSKFVLDDAGIEYDDSNYKTKISEVDDFEAKYETALEYYYKIYLTYYGKLTEGSVSISTVLEKISLCKEDYEKWLTSKDSLPVTEAISGYNAQMIVEEGDDDSSGSSIQYPTFRAFDSTAKLSINTYNKIDLTEDTTLTLADSVTNGLSEYKAQLNVKVATAVVVSVPSSIASVSYDSDDSAVSISGCDITITAGNATSVFTLDVYVSDIGYARLTRIL